MAFTTEQMDGVGEALTQALSHQLANTFGETKTKVMLFVYNHVLRRKSYMMLTDEGVNEITGIVMQDSEVRDFVFDLTFHFGVYWSGSENDWKELATVLGDAAGVIQTAAIPKAVLERMTTPEVASRKLQHNRWLVVLILLLTWVEAPSETDVKGKGKNKEEA